MDGEKAGRFIIVLAGPYESGNIGMACRAMKTMGLTRLRIAGGATRDEELVRRFAVHAWDVYERSLSYPDLENALEDVSLAAGTTRRRGEGRKTYSMPIDEFATFAWNRPDGDIAIVFGNEKHGLSEDELALCDMAVHIPSSDIFPSLNLAQAVQVVSYEIFKNRPDALVPSYTPVSREELERDLAVVCDALDTAGFFPAAVKDSRRTRKETELFLRDLLARGAASKSEVSRFCSLLRKSARVSVIDRNEVKTLD